MSDDRPMGAGPSNQDLPILDELGDHLVMAFRRQERAEAGRRNRRRFRHVIIATAALLVVVPGAVATRYIWAPDPGAPAAAGMEGNRAIQIADGRSGRFSWRLSAAVTERDGLCWQAAVFTATSDFGRSASCSGYADGQPLGGATMQAEGETFMFGWLDPRAARVVVHPGRGRAPRDARVVVAPADRVEAAGLPAGTRGYVVSLPGDVGSRGMPTVVAFDAAGRELGRLPPRR